MAQTKERYHAQHEKYGIRGPPYWAAKKIQNFHHELTPCKTNAASNSDAPNIRNPKRRKPAWCMTTWLDL
jgi:hypothetical protein